MTHTFFPFDRIEVRGNRSGLKKTTCPLCSHTRKKKTDPCLSVNFETGKAKCWNCGALSFKEESRPVSNRPFTLPAQDWRNYTALSDKLVRWCETERKIRQSVLIDMGITEESVWMPALQKPANAITFNYFEGEQVVNKKYRDAKKNFTQSKNGKPIMYNVNNIIGESEVYIVEGEFDVLALRCQGITNAVSVPNGANDHDDYWINSEPYLRDVERFIIATDNDEKGIALRERIAQRLGRYRCAYIEWQHKDANGGLIEGSISDDLSNIKRFPVSGTFTASDLHDDVMDLYTNGLPKTLKPKHHSWGNLSNIFSVMRGHLVTVTGIPSHGKALYVDTPIPTPNGFVRMVDLKIGDTVFDENGNQCKVKWKSEIWKGRPTYRMVFSDNSEIVCDENHEWLTDTWESRRSYANAKKNNRLVNRDVSAKGNDQTDKRTFESVKTTREIAATLKTKADNRNNHSVKISKPVNTPTANLPIHPYVLGCWLGDGSSYNGGLTSDDAQIIDNIKALGYKVTKRSSKCAYGIIGIMKPLRKMGLLKNKHIPTEYMFASIEQRRQLLMGLMDTDGHCSTVEARNEFCCINKRLAEHVYQLVSSLGVKATFVEGDAKINGRHISPKYRVFFKANEVFYGLTRKQKVIEEYFESGRNVRGNDVRYVVSCELVEGYETQCIEVDSDSHLFLAGHQFIPTHNSEFTEWFVLNLVHDHDMKVSLYSPEHSPMSLHQTKFMQKALGMNFWKEMDGVSRMQPSDMERYRKWADQRIYFTGCGKGEAPTWDWLFDVFKEQMFTYGVDIFVIDAFNKLQLPDGPERSEINRVLTKLTSFAQANNVVVFLVAHPTKMKKDQHGVYEAPNLYDVSGSADFRNQTHDGYCIYRNFPTDGKGNYSTFYNLKTKMSFQGDIGASVDIEYHIPTSRYYAKGMNPPIFDMTRPMSEQVLSDVIPTSIRPNTSFYEPSTHTTHEADSFLSDPF